MKKVALALALLITSVTAFAGPIDGKWTGSIDTPNGKVDLVYQLASEGTTLTGNAIGPDGTPVPLQNGKIEGNKLSFTLTFTNMGPEPLVFHYTGDLAGDELTLRSDFMGQPFEFKLKKVS